MQSDPGLPKARDGSRRLPAELAERVLGSHPLPVADAVAALLAADSVFEERDRVVEVFRAEVRLLSALVLSARLQLGPGPGGDSAQVTELLRGLRARGLTDGQWIAMLREGLRSWSGAHEGFPLPELVTLFHARKAELPKLFDELLVMRKSETVAHGATGTRAAIEQILDKRVPQIARTLELTGALWSRASVCVPLAVPDDPGAPQPAWLVMGSTPHRGKFRKIELSGGRPLPPGEPVLVDREGKPLVALHPISMFRRPSPDSTEELFFLDGAAKRGALYVAFPSMSEHREAHAWSLVEGALADDEPVSEEAAASAGAPKGRPYRGLASFGPEDAALFFGREEQAESLANRVRRHGFLTITGPSGSGKSSLLRAGVLPLLRDATTTFVRPGADPIASLAARLAESTSEDREELAALVKTDPSALASLVDRGARAAEKLHVVVVDQGEELVTLTADADVREKFGRALVALAGGGGSTRVVFGVREDFFGRIASVPCLKDLYSRQVEVVTTPDRMALIRTLIAPAQAFGYVFEDEELVTTMVDAVAEAPAALALLQFCADRLWEQRDRKWKRLTWDAYKALGGVAGALAQHADSVVAGFSGSERSVCRSIFLRLVSGERTRAVVSRADLLDALRDPEAGARVLDQLIDARLVAVTDVEGGGSTVEIVHEALIKHWTALDRWLGEDEEGQRLAHAMRAAAREWNARGRPRDLVWRGDLLEELRIYRHRLTEALVGMEAAFSDASEAEAKRGRRLRAGLVSTALVLMAGFSVFALWQWRSTEAARSQAETERRATAHEKVNVEIRGLVAEARGHEPAGRTGHALALLRAAISLEGDQGAKDSTLLSLELERLARAGAGGRVLAGHTSSVFRACLPAGRDRVITTGLDDTIRVWQLSTGVLLHTIETKPQTPRSLDCAPDGRTFAIGDSDAKGNAGAVTLWDAETGEKVRAFEAVKAPTHEVAFVAGGARLVANSLDSHVRTFEVESGAVVSDIEAGQGDVAFTRDGTLVATTDDNRLDVWKTGEKEPVHTFKAGARIATIALADDGTRVAWAELEGGVVSLVDLGDGSVVKQLKPAGTLGVAHIGFSPGGETLVTSGPRGVDLFRAKDGSRIGRLRADPQETTFVFSPDAKRLVTLRSSSSAELWDIATGARLAGFTGHESEIETIAFSADGSTLVTGSFDKTARIHDATPRSLVHFWPVGESIVRSFGVSVDGARLATLGADSGEPAVHLVALERPGLTPLVGPPVPGSENAHQVAMAPDGRRVLVTFQSTKGAPSRRPTFFDAESGARLGEIALDANVETVAFSPNGHRIALGTSDGSVHLVDAEGKPERVVEVGKASLSLFRWSPTSELLVASTIDHKLAIIRAETGEIVLRPSDSVGMTADAKFTNDGSALAIADQERVRRFDTATWQVEEQRDHEQAVIAIAFSPDGNTLASGSADQTIVLRRAGRPPIKLTGHTEAVLDLDFSPDGHRLVSGGEDGTARVWDLDLGASLDVLDPFGGAVDGVKFLGDDRVLAIGRGANGGSAAVLSSPAADRVEILGTTGESSNLRVCRATFAVVPIAPAPSPVSVWAPDESCPKPVDSVQVQPR